MQKLLFKKKKKKKKLYDKSIFMNWVELTFFNLIY